MFPICISFCKQCISTFPDFVLFFIKPAKYTIIKGILTRWLHSEITYDGHSSVQPSPALNLLQIWLKFYLRSFFLYLALITPQASSAKSLLPFTLMGTCSRTSTGSHARKPSPAKFTWHFLVFTWPLLQDSALFTCTSTCWEQPKSIVGFCICASPPPLKKYA